MKILKVMLKAVVVLVVLVLAALLTMPIWFGPVVKTVANKAVPGIVKTDFQLRHLSLNPYTARFELGELSLGNPQGYSVKEAVRVGEVIFDAETFSLMTDVIHIEEVTLRDLFVSVVSGGENNVLNFKQIQYNVAGGKEKYEAAQSAQAAKAEASQGKPASERKSGAEKPAKKVVIDRLEVSGLTIQLSVLPIRIPSIVLTGIGRKTGGATFEEAWQQILEGVMKAAGVAGDQLKALGAFSGEAAKKAGEAVTKVTEKATTAVSDATKQISATTEKATAAMGDATKQISATTGKATEAVSSTVGGATDAAKDAVSGGAKVVGEGAKAVGEGAKKAMDSLKSLW